MNDGFEKLVANIQATGRKYDLDKIRRAYEYAAKMHEGQYRLSGEPYICHPVAVAAIVLSLDLDTDSICAALLHDTVEDCADKTNLQEIKRLFGDEVALLVDGVTKIKLLQVRDKEEEHIENIRKMLLAMNQDIRVIFIKLCDRLHNMRTLFAKTEERRRDIALETMHIYAPLAHRLGMQRIKQELENLSLKYLDPIGYEEVLKAIEEKYGQSAGLIENAKEKIKERLTEAGIPFEIEGRTKSVYSLYRKMYSQNKNFDEIYDFYALRIIVGTELECYTVLGIIHEAFNSIPGRFKDYISTPKPNLYRSLHTTVIGHDGIPFEVQIRTREMHEVAEYGIAAHWKYKSGEKSKESIDEKLRWIASLLEANDNTRDPDEFIQSFKTDIFHDETFVFTPKGDVISLPLGATVIDFAYAIHSAVGNKMVGAKINGKIVPIDRVPQNGDIVEILTSSASRGPSRDWLKIVKTGEARNKIRAWFKKEKRDENIEVGKDELDRELKRYGRSYTEKQRDEVADAVGRLVGINGGADDFYSTIGFGGLTVSRLTKMIHDEFDRVCPPEKLPEELPTEPVVIPSKKTNGRVKRGSGIVVDGQTGCQVKFAKCCNPLPGDAVVGFITRGFGISIHKADCPNAVASRSNPAVADRWVEAHWELGNNEAGTDLFEAILSIRARDRIGVLAKITSMLAEMKVSVLDIAIKPVPDKGFTLINLTVGCRNVAHAESIVSRLRTLENVESVCRGSGT